MSIIVKESAVPEGVENEKGWRAFKIEGLLDFSQCGIIASISALLAEAGIPIFVFSTYNTDYIFVKQENLPKAREVLAGKYNIVA